MDDSVEEVTAIAVAILLTIKVCAAEVPPPGTGLTTVTKDVVGVARSDARMVAVSIVFEINVVVLTEPFHRTEEEALKFAPVSVSVKPLLPAIAEAGERTVRDGAGFEKAAAAE